MPATKSSSVPKPPSLLKAKVFYALIVKPTARSGKCNTDEFSFMIGVKTSLQEVRFFSIEMRLCLVS